MKKLISIFIFLGLALISFIAPYQVSAAITIKTDPSPVYSNLNGYKLILESDIDLFRPGQNYSFGYDPGPSFIVATKTQNPRLLEFQIQRRLFAGIYTFQVWLGTGTRDYNQSSRVSDASGTIRIYPPAGPSGSGLPAIKLDSDTFQAYTIIPVYLLNAQANQNYTLWFNEEKTFLLSRAISASEIGQTKYGNGATLSINTGTPATFPKKLCMTQSDAKVGTIGLICDFKVGLTIVSGVPPSGSPVQSNEIGFPSAKPTAAPPEGPCKEVTDPTTNKKTSVCETAFGDIDTNPAGFIRSIFTILLSFAGVIAVILIIVSGYRFMNSQGNPEKVQEAREQLTSAIVGLLFIIFSIAILQIIGVDILKIPGFER